MRATRCLDAEAIRPCLQSPEGTQMLLGIAYELVIQEIHLFRRVDGKLRGRGHFLRVTL